MLEFITKPQVAQFVTKVNRFTVEVIVDGVGQAAHLPNSGRLLSILQPGQACWVTPVQSTARKTNYDLLAMELPAGPVFVDSRLPGLVIKDALLKHEICSLAGYDRVKPEYRYGNSRVDFLLQGPNLAHCLLEVKSASDYSEAVAKFPDAPSERARRHLTELMSAVAEGWRGVALLAAQMPWATCVQLNGSIDPGFVAVAREARSAGVEFLAFVFHPCLPHGVQLGRQIPVEF